MANINITDAQANVDRLNQELATAKGELKDAQSGTGETAEEANKRFIAEQAKLAVKDGSTSRPALTPAKTPAKVAAESGTRVEPKATLKPGKAKK